MDTIMDLVSDVLTAVGGLVVFASFIAKLTPTKKDDDFLNKTKNLIEKFSIVAASRKKEGE